VATRSTCLQRAPEERSGVLMQQDGLEPCPKCGGERIEVKLVTVGNAPLVAMQPLRDQKKLIRKHNQSPFVTSACVHCGYVDI
jgi:predicted nucleic-acid-binding Zn-ribbon protein